jgi:PAS domain S-box-containing protein
MRDFGVFDDLNFGVQVIDAEMRYRYVNAALGRVVGLDPDWMCGQRMVDVFPGFDTTDIYAVIARCMESDQHSKYVNEFTFPDGRLTWHELDLHRIDEGVLIFSRDITESRRGEILLRETAKNQEHFAHLAAHDMREPVRRMLLLSEELLLDFEQELPAEALYLSRMIHGQATSLMELISDFRSLSSITRGHSRSPELVSMRDQFAAVVETMADRFAAADIVVRLPEQDFRVAAVPSMVAILLRNLLENALRHGHSEVVVGFDLNRQPPAVTVSNPTHNPPLSSDPFLPFVGRDRSRGTGLGLAIAKRVLTHHGGDIRATHEGGLFAVEFVFPAMDAPSSTG